MDSHSDDSSLQLHSKCVLLNSITTYQAGIKLVSLCVKPKECKDQWTYLCESTEQGHRQGTWVFFHLLFYTLFFTFCLFLWSVFTMCLQIPTITNTKLLVTCWKLCNNLHTFPMPSSILFSFPIGLWNCQSKSKVNKADFITSITSHSGLNLMALTET